MLRKLALVLGALLVVVAGALVLIDGDDEEIAARARKWADEGAERYRNDCRAGWLRGKHRPRMLASWRQSMEQELSRSLEDVEVLDVRERDDGTTAVAEFDFAAERRSVRMKGVARSYFAKEGTTLFWLFADEKTWSDPESVAAVALERADALVRANPGRRPAEYLELAGYENTGRDEGRVQEVGGALFLWTAPEHMSVLYAQGSTAAEYAELRRTTLLKFFGTPKGRAALERGVMEAEE
ncbi:MAG: hypothetical protein ACOZQL_36745 [Myxococcota bacterium]